MNALDATDSIDSADDDFPDPPLAQPDPDIYLPGTPTASFVEYVAVAIRTLRR
ncbi:hypothetical protein [Natrinema saccharevitans]|uniref:hypothetical protein n=1 Tax=Natrinema saccharevitans TaxID=301967 RepID=UPI00158F1F73|nr:hypothetical protein [Natrinema saccharevitans]